MDFKALEKQLMELAEEMGGKEFVEELLRDKETIFQNPEQNEPEQNEMDNEMTTDFFEAKGRVLDVELIRVRMKECNLTLKQVQEQVGVSYRTVTRWLSRTEVPRQQNFTRLAEVLGLEPHQLVRNGMFGKQDILDENLRFVQRSLESIITEILEDDKIPKDKKVNALTKYYSVLIKAKK